MAALTREARQVLAEMQMLMFGKSASYNSSGGGKAESEQALPQGESRPPADIWMDSFLAAPDGLLGGLVAKAREELESIKKRDMSLVDSRVEEPRDAWELRLIEEGEGYEARHVATSFMCAVQDVTRIRLRHKRDPNDGRPALVSAESERGLAKRLGVSKSTARRMMGKAA